MYATAPDQNMNSDTLKIIGDVDTLHLTTSLHQRFWKQVKRVHRPAPSHLFDGGQ